MAFTVFLVWKMPRNFGPESNAVERRKVSYGGQDALVKAHQTLIGELEAVLVNRNIGSRADVLRRVTDLFVTGSDRFNGEQRALFDDVMGRLVDEIESSARAEFGERLSTISNAPPRVCRVLALDDSIEVAGPLLAHSDQLNDETLIAGAKTKSQEHLLAISRRKLLTEGVTDVLVERGNQQVVVSTAANSGARFSEISYSTLITRSKTDDELALTIWARSEIPREHLLTMFATASEAVRVKLEAADRGKAALVRDMIRQATDQIQTQVREHSPKFVAAQAQVLQLHHAGALTENRLCEFAKAGKFDETAVALALLSDLPIGAIERTLVHEHSDQVLVLAKSIDLSWDTTKAILLMQHTTMTKSRSTHEFEQCHSSFTKLKPETARTAIQFYRLRERATQAVSN
jgi:uncharacterized protein (DUF2336 family)